MSKPQDSQATLANLQRQIAVVEERLKTFDAEWNLQSALLRAAQQRLGELRARLAEQLAALERMDAQTPSSVRAKLEGEIAALERAAAASEMQVTLHTRQSEERRRELERSFEAGRRKLVVLQRAVAALEENREAQP